MRRRLLVAAAAAWPLIGWTRIASAQSKRAPLVIGWLSNGSRESGAASLAAFRQALADLGWKEGAQVVIETRWADGHADRAGALAADLAARQPAVMVGTTLRMVAALNKAAPATPIVQISGANPVTAGLAASLARPGGMVTGITGLPVDASEKYIELLASTVPRLRRVGFLIDPNVLAPDIHRKTARQAAKRLSLEPLLAEAATAEASKAANPETCRSNNRASSNW
jgi:putative ABC transport system substrate-binding protein